MAKGFSIAEQGHVVNILPPIDVDTGGGAHCVVINMECYQHCSIIIQTGVTDAVPGTITIEEVATYAGVGVPIVFEYYQETVAAGDTLAARAAAAVGGLVLSANDNCIYVIEIDASQLSDGFNYLQVEWSNPGGSTIGSAVAVLSGSRYASDASGITTLA